MKNPVPRPSQEIFSLAAIDPKKLANLQTFDPPELEKRDFLIFHGLKVDSFSIGGFRKLYGDYIDYTAPSLTKMIFSGLWSNVCISASLIHPSKSVTWAPQGLILRVPYQLIYLADSKDASRTTHTLAKDFGPYLDMSFQRKKILSRDDCFKGTTEWHNEIQFVPEAVVDGTPYSITVTGLWVRDKIDEKIGYANAASSTALAMVKNMSAELGIPLILSSEWEKK